MQVCVVETALRAGIRTSYEQGSSACHRVWSEAPADASNDATNQQQQQRSLVLTGLPMAAIKTVLQQVLLTMAHSTISSSSSSSGSNCDSLARSAVQQPLLLVGASMVRLRAQLRSAGLSTDGARGELLERLQTATTASASIAAGDTATHSEDASSDSTTDTDAEYSDVHVVNEHVHSAQHDLVIEGVQGVGALVRAYLTKQLQPLLVFSESTGITFDVDGDAVDDSASGNSTTAAAAAREGTLILSSAQLQQWQQSYIDSQLSAAAASDGAKAKKRASYETPRYS
jgi:hypothetical protein